MPVASMRLTERRRGDTLPEFTRTFAAGALLEICIERWSSLTGFPFVCFKSLSILDAIRLRSQLKHREAASPARRQTFHL